MNNHFAIIDHQNQYLELPGLTFYQHNPKKGHARLLTKPEVCIIEAARCQDLPSEFEAQMNKAILRAQELVAAFKTDKFTLATDIMYDITEDRHGLKYISAFPALEMGGNKYHTFITSKYISDINLDDLRKVKIRTGSCLFSEQAARFVLNDGRIGPSIVVPSDPPPKPFVDIAIDDAMTLYEHETAVRLGMMIADFINALPKNATIEIVTDVPRVQYYMYSMDLYNQGLVDSKLMLKWFDAVDQRSGQVRRQLEKRTANRVTAERTIVFCKTSTLKSLETYLRQQIKNGDMVLLKECIGALQKSGDELTELLIGRGKIRDFRDLSNVSYIAQMLRTGLNDSANEIGIDIENHIERRAFSYVEDVAAKVRRLYPNKKFSLLGLYSRERFLTTDETWRPSLYCFDPGRYASGAKFAKMDLFNIVEQFYNIRS